MTVLAAIAVSRTYYDIELYKFDTTPARGILVCEVDHDLYARALYLVARNGT